MPELTSSTPWTIHPVWHPEGELAYCELRDPSGRVVARVGREEDAVFIVEAGRAYSCLDKALEACRWLEAARRLRKASVLIANRDAPRLARKLLRVVLRAEDRAREALEMEERGRRD